jgi:hypothetical protein
LIGTLIPVALSVIVRVLPRADGIDPQKAVLSVDIFAFASVLTFWIGVLTVAIGCVVVAIMKGPAYVADPYPVAHANRPQIDKRTGPGAPGQQHAQPSEQGSKENSP